MPELRGSIPGRGIFWPCCLDRFSFQLLFFTYWLVSFYLQSYPFTASRDVAFNVFLYLRVRPLCAGNIWVMVCNGNRSVVCLRQSLPTVLHTEWA